MSPYVGSPAVSWVSGSVPEVDGTLRQPHHPGKVGQAVLDGLQGPDRNAELVAGLEMVAGRPASLATFGARSELVRFGDDWALGRGGARCRAIDGSSTFRGHRSR